MSGEVWLSLKNVASIMYLIYMSRFPKHIQEKVRGKKAEPSPEKDPAGVEHVSWRDAAYLPSLLVVTSVAKILFSLEWIGTIIFGFIFLLFLILLKAGDAFTWKVQIFLCIFALSLLKFKQIIIDIWVWETMAGIIFSAVYLFYGLIALLCFFCCYLVVRMMRNQERHQELNTLFDQHLISFSSSKKMQGDVLEAKDISSRPRAAQRIYLLAHDLSVKTKGGVLLLTLLVSIAITAYWAHSFALHSHGIPWPETKGKIEKITLGFKGVSWVVHYQYRVKGIKYSGDFEITRQRTLRLVAREEVERNFPEGSTLLIHYNPDHPSISTTDGVGWAFVAKKLAFYLLGPVASLVLTFFATLNGLAALAVFPALLFSS